MAEIEIKSEKTLNYSEVADKLKIIKKNLGENEPGFRTTKAQEFIDSFGKEGLKKVSDLKKALETLDVQRLKERQINNLANVQPTDEDSIKIILSNDNITLKEDDLKKIVDCMK